jgi:hypothetical protein
MLHHGKIGHHEGPKMKIMIFISSVELVSNSPRYQGTVRWVCECALDCPFTRCYLLLRAGNACFDDVDSTTKLVPVYHIYSIHFLLSLP